MTDLEVKHEEKVTYNYCGLDGSGMHFDMLLGVFI